MRTVGYVRVSTDEQARNGLSPEGQESRIKSFCESQGWDLIKIYSAPGPAPGPDFHSHPGPSPGFKKFGEGIAHNQD
jgi:DNA invertase Pin-like site-specific DNA recombinase